jgi:hypothetical protein
VGPRVGLDSVAKGKNQCICRESNPVRRGRRIVTILTELPRLPCYYYTYINLQIFAMRHFVCLVSIQKNKLVTGNNNMLVQTVMKLYVPKKAGNLLTCSVTIRF